jgi:hypothetical protein
MTLFSPAFTRRGWHYVPFNWGSLLSPFVFEAAGTGAGRVGGWKRLVGGLLRLAGVFRVGLHFLNPTPRTPINARAGVLGLG